MVLFRSSSPAGSSSSKAAGAISRALSGSAALRRLRSLRLACEDEAPRAKRELLRRLAGAKLGRAKEVRLLHDTLCFLRAYPDDPQTLALVKKMLADFADRDDLRRHRSSLSGTGIAGTALESSFYWFTAEWLARRWPERLTVDWSSFARSASLDAWMYPLLKEHERMAYDEAQGSLREIIDGLKAPDETDATYLVGCFRDVSKNPMIVEQAFEDLEIPMRLEPGATTPNRTRASFPVPRVHFRTTPWRAGGTVKQRIGQDPLTVRRASAREARLLYRLGREAMITRGRDLFAFLHADVRDTRLVDFGDGLLFSCMGLVPERRHLLYGQYILLALQNGIPVAYSQACTLFDSAEVNFNVFECFRDAEASRIFTSSLALIRHLFDVDAFTINTHQIGEDNPEALKTGAWWFYHKHGFRPGTAELDRVIARELAAKRRNPAHRSNLATLRDLSEHELFLFLGRPRRACLNKVDLSAIGANVARRVAERLGVSGARAVQACAREAARLLGVRSTRAWSPGEKQAWKRWGPLVVALPGRGEWSREEKKGLVAVIRAKGGKKESEFVRLFREHTTLVDAVLRLAGRKSAASL